jgi:hypothetical protein
MCADASGFCLNFQGRLVGGGVGHGHGMRDRSVGILPGLQFASVRLLGSHPLLVEHDSESFEVIEVIRSSADHELLDLELETVVEHGNKDGFITPPHFQDQLLKLLNISADGASLSDHIGELVLGLLFCM